MKIIANYTRKLIDDNGNVEITFTVDNWAFKRIVNDLMKQPYILDISAPKNSRSINQNNYLWENITKISRELNIDKIDLYCQLLEMAGIKAIVMTVPKETVERLKDYFRVVKPTPSQVERNDGQIEVLVYEGSSKFNTKEMSELIDRVKDYAAESGIYIDDYEGR